MVIVAEDEWSGWQETVHLLSNPANATRLLESIRQADAGELHEHNLIQAAPSNRT